MSEEKQLPPSGEQPGYVQPQSGYGQPQPVPSDNVNVVVAQPQVPPQTLIIQPVTPPPDYLILSIVSCFFCWPMAICALMYSNNSRNSSHAGDYVSAEQQGRTAKNFAVGAIVSGIVIIVVAVVLRLVLYTSYSTTYYY